MVTQHIHWHGTPLEFAALDRAVAANCICDGDQHVTCTAHRMEDQDQRACDGLLFARHIADRLRKEEFGGRAGPE